MGEFDYEKALRPEFFQENRMEAHSDHVCYASREEAERAIESLGGAMRLFGAGEGGFKPSCEGAQWGMMAPGEGERLFAEEGSSLRHSLDGAWKFHYARNYSQVIPGFWRDEYDCRAWEDIRVPAHVQMEGYGAPQYANTQYPWDGREEAWGGEVPTEYNPVACYAKYVTLPEGFVKNGVYISIQGAESAAAVWVNGEYVGFGGDSFSPSEFDLTPYWRDGENKVALAVFKWTAGSWCEDQDFFRFSGVFRSVYLYTMPAVHVFDLKAEPVVSNDLSYADFKLSLSLRGSGSLRVTLQGPEGAVFSKALDNASGVVKMEGRVEHPRLWSAEEPSLYDLWVELYDEGGACCEAVRERVGFRRFEMKDGIMCLNGRRIVFKGVNRHEFGSRAGRVLSPEEVLADVVTMKRNNINAIRTCHYPDGSLIYRLCDEYGLYMIAENNMETHGTWDAYLQGRAEQGDVIPGDDMAWEPMLLDRVESCYQRDKNHPSILIWSCGNESYGGKVIYDMAERFRALDPGRLVHYEGIFHDRRYDKSSDMESQMYPSVAQIREHLAKIREKPFICCEYSHAMGNSCGAMHKYTDLSDEEPRYQGGFIWDYIDQSIVKKDRYGREFQAYGGDFGDRPTDYEFSGNGICYGGGREPSPKMQEVKFNYQNVSVSFAGGEFLVKNKNLFLSTDAYACELLLEREGIPVGKERVETNVPPLSERAYPIPFGILSGGGPLDAEYALTVSFRLREDAPWAKAGHEVAFGQKVYAAGAAASAAGSSAAKAGAGDAGAGYEASFEQRVYPAGAAAKAAGSAHGLRVVHGRWNLGVRGDDFEALFSYNSKGLVSYRHAGVEMLERIPMPNFWRAPTDNDRGNGMPARMAQWKVASLYVGMPGNAGPAEMPAVKEEDGAVFVTYAYPLPTTPAASCSVTYKVLRDGTVETRLHYDPVEALGDMPEFGMMFTLPADYGCVSWYGLGPEETYADRMRGARLGIFQNRVGDNLARYLRPQECGQKMGVRWAKVTDERGRGMAFFGDGICFSALPYTPHELENARHAFELPEPHYTIVRVAMAQMGVGGDDSWGAPVHPEYHIDASRPLDFSFSFRGI